MARIHFRPGHPGALPSAWLIRPATPGPANALVAVHGLNREAEAMAEALACRADATGRTLVLPVFDRAAWPRFQHAACPQRADWGLLALLRVLRAEGWIGAAPPDLSGFSGGAQFAHRFAWLYPEEVGRLCLVAPGWWTFPDARGAHPRGLAPGGGAEDAVATFRLTANLPRFLDREIDVRVGALDTEQDRNLRQDPDVVAQQGAHRVARARAWVAAARLAAEARGIAPRIAFHLMENCGHSFADCIAIGG
ncbi:MAG: hypothetical protein ACOCYW_01390, partial [Roseicyclus sp.]